MFEHVLKSWRRRRSKIPSLFISVAKWAVKSRLKSRMKISWTFRKNVNKFRHTHVFESLFRFEKLSGRWAKFTKFSPIFEPCVRIFYKNWQKTVVVARTARPGWPDTKLGKNLWLICGVFSWEFLCFSCNPSDPDVSRALALLVVAALICLYTISSKTVERSFCSH